MSSHAVKEAVRECVGAGTCSILECEVREGGYEALFPPLPTPAPRASEIPRGPTRSDSVGVELLQRQFLPPETWEGYGEGSVFSRVGRWGCLYLFF